jgi:5-methyltetrahydropteroyltriglutamate--homocysteine methyltransferase
MLVRQAGTASRRSVDQGAMVRETKSCYLSGETVQQSVERIITTHVGSLARPTELLETLREKEAGRHYDHAELDLQILEAVIDRVNRQVDAGIDVVTDGEMSKVSFLTYVKDRLSGFVESTDDTFIPPSWQKEMDDFPEFYGEYMKKYTGAVSTMRALEAVGPISYVGHDQLYRDIANLKAACADHPVTEMFMPSTGPSGFGRNVHYASHGEFLAAVGEAMRVEYLAIVEAGIVLQVDDPFLIELLTDPTSSPEERARNANEHIEVVNHSLRGIPKDRIRHHTCYGLNHGPRLTDLPMDQVIPWMLKINAGAYSFEVANPRHSHEWKAWRDVAIPDDVVLIPGLLGHATNYVEHPGLIADWIEAYASIVGKERVIAGADCGFSSRATFTPEVHPTVVWAKFDALAQGAALATERLY